MMQAPDYVRLDGRRLDEFLNHRGNFTPDERGMFQKLCSSWEPVIPYQRFLRFVGETAENQRTLDSLLTKLYQAGVGVVTTGKAEDGTLVREGIVLTSDRSARFYRCALDEYVRTLRHDPDQPLPFAGTLAEQGLQIPEAYLTDIEATDIASLLSDAGENSDRILRITTPSGLQLIITEDFVRRFLGLAMQKLRHLLSNSNTLAAVARLLDSSLTALQNEIEGKEPKFWFRLTETILAERDHLSAQRTVPVNQEFFAAAEILHAFVNGQITEFRRRKEAEQERIETINAVLAMISRRDAPVMAIDELKSLIESYREVFTEDFDSFRHDFFETALQPAARRRLAVLQEFDDIFIHRDRLYPFFLSEIERLNNELRHEYLEAMRSHIRSKRRYDAFFSYARFVSDIEDTLRQREPLFFLMYESPEVMSEALLHWAKQQGVATDQAQLRKLLSRHFVPGTTRFVSIDILLDLNLEEIFETAFRSLSPLWQIIYRLFGRYEALRQRYTAEQAKRNEPEAVWKPSGGSTERKSSGQAGGTGTSERGIASVQQQKDDTPLSSLSRTGKAKKQPVLADLPRQAAKSAAGQSSRSKPKKQRQYTRRESERAWEEFKRRIES